jgi:hypothetical protein
MKLLTVIALCVPTVFGIQQDIGHPDRCYNKWHELTWSDGVEIPDAKYDHQPDVPYFVETVGRPVINAICSSDSDACTFPPTKDYPFCITFLQKSYEDGALPEHVKIHERAHCNGWNHHDQ